MDDVEEDFENLAPIRLEEGDFTQRNQLRNADIGSIIIEWRGGGQEGGRGGCGEGGG